MNISSLLNIQLTTVFFPKNKAKGMKRKDEQDGKAVGNLGKTLTLPGLSGQAWNCAINS